MARPWSRPSTKARSSYLSSLSSVLFCHAHVNGHSEIIGRSGISTPPLRDAGPPRANAVLVTVRRFTLLSRAVPGPSTIHTHIPVYERVRFQVDSTEAEKSREERNGRYEIQKYAQLRPAPGLHGPLDSDHACSPLGETEGMLSQTSLTTQPETVFGRRSDPDLLKSLCVGHSVP